LTFDGMVSRARSNIIFKYSGSPKTNLRILFERSPWR
jgi:hypothetical protein